MNKINQVYSACCLNIYLLGADCLIQTASHLCYQQLSYHTKLATAITRYYSQSAFVPSQYLNKQGSHTVTLNMANYRQ